MRYGLIIAAASLLLAGCEAIRFAPSEEQKQNAWVHNRTAAIAAQTAKEEYASGKLQALTDLSRTQSKAFVAYCGLPASILNKNSPDGPLQL